MFKRMVVMVPVVVMAGALAVLAGGDDIAQNPSCKYCGMKRAMFSHSRMLLEYDDGTVVGTCSVHCAAVDLAMNIDKTPTAMMVGDMNTRELVDAEAAAWVVGGNKPGVMTKRAKWAFAKQADAEAFIKEHGGEAATFDDAMKAAYEDMYQDTRMIRAKRKMKKQGGMKMH